MALSRQRKLYLAVLGVAGAGLVADRLVFRTGATGPANAAAFATAPAPANEVMPPVPEQASAALAAPTLAQRLRELAGSEELTLDGIVDAFRPVREEPAQEPVVQNAPDPVAAPPEADEKFRFGGVLSIKAGESAKAAAIIDGKLRFVGDEVRGFTVISVNAEDLTAVLERAGQRIVLTVDLPR